MTTAPRTKKFKQQLDYHFTHDELLVIGKELGECQLKLRQLDDDRKMVADEWKAKISSAENHITSLSNKTSSGYEYRDVECTITFDAPVAGEKTVTRNDTGAVVKILAMEDFEKQQELPLETETAARAFDKFATDGTTITVTNGEKTIYDSEARKSSQAAGGAEK